MMKCYQVPVLFTQSSEEPYDSDQVGTFIVMFYEKCVRKRTFAKTQAQKQRLKRYQELKKHFDPARGRILEESLYYRESKMRRFCNYFVTLFHQKKLNPFSQFVSGDKLKAIKQKVRDKMNQYTEEEANLSEERKQEDAPNSSRKQATEVQKPSVSVQKQALQENKASRRKKSSINSSVSAIDMVNVPTVVVSNLLSDLESVSHRLPYSKSKLGVVRQSLQPNLKGTKKGIMTLQDLELNQLYYGFEKRKHPLVNSNVRFSENGYQDLADSRNKPQQKSKSVLSHYLSSKLDRVSQDFDEIHEAQPNRHSSYESEELQVFNPVEDALQHKSYYAGKSSKSRQPTHDQIKQDSSKF